MSIGSARAWDCKIQSWASDAVENYLKNLKNILNNIESEIKDNSNQKQSIYSSSIKYINDLFSFERINNEIDFFSYYSKFNEIPKEVQRDYNRLKFESNIIIELVKKVWEKNIWDKTWIDFCKWISWNCNLSKDLKIEDVLTKIWENHEKIKDIFLKIYNQKITYDENLKIFNEIILIDKNFFIDIETNYSKQNSLECSKEEWWFWDTIRKRTSEIFNNENSAKQWIKKWKEAIELLNKTNSSKTEEYQALEKDLLQKELSRQWVSWDNQKNMFESLDKFNNEWWTSLSKNNFITNTLRSARDNFKKSFEEIKQETLSDFHNINNWNDVNLNKSLWVENKSFNIKNISANIDLMYKELSNIASIWEYNSDNLRNRLINTHIEVSNSINTLIQTCKMSVMICNQQDSWNWNCWDCNW